MILIQKYICMHCNLFHLLYNIAICSNTTNIYYYIFKLYSHEQIRINRNGISKQIYWYTESLNRYYLPVQEKLRHLSKFGLAANELIRSTFWYSLITRAHLIRRTHLIYFIHTDLYFTRIINFLTCFEITIKHVRTNKSQRKYNIRYKSETPSHIIVQLRMHYSYLAYFILLVSFDKFIENEFYRGDQSWDQSQLQYIHSILYLF